MNEIEPIKTEETHRQLQSTESVDINLSQITIKTSRIDIHANSPVGLLGFAFACFLTGVSFTNLTNYTSTHLSEYLFFGGFCQYLIGVFDWYRGNTIGSFISVNFGLYNMVFLFWELFPKYAIADVKYNDSAGIFNVGMCILTLSDIIDALPGGKVNLLNQIVVFISFVLGTINSFKPNDKLTKAIGYFYFLITAITIYIYFALQLLFIYGHTILPLLNKDEKIVCSFK
jgi:succinate-acetate transporter protein